MKTEERLLIIAANENAVNTVCEILESLAAEYIEGYQDWAGVIFNRYFPKMNRQIQTQFIHTTVFRKLANKLAVKYDIAKPWREVGEHSFNWEYKGFFQNPFKSGNEVHLLVD